MSGYNNYPQQQRDFTFSPFRNQGDRSYQRNSYSRPQNFQPKKHSGAKLTIYKNQAGAEKHLTTGWRLTKNRQFLQYKCITTKKSELKASGWFGSVYCTITDKNTGMQSSYWGTMEKKTGKVVIQELALVLNPRAKNGGYCGTFLK
jgi:hypothetical protein